MKRIWPATLTAICTAAIGCAGSGSGGDTRVASGDFVNPAQTTPQAEPTAPPDFVSTTEEARRGVVDVQVSAGAPPTPVNDPRPTGELILVDALVGDIHGQPIYVNQFFEGNADLAGVGGRLRAKARELTPEEWVPFAYKTIAEQLILIRNNKIMVAEGRAQLPPQIQAGLINYIQQFQEDLKSQNRGSSTLAEQTAQNTQGQSAHQLAENQLEEQLIQILQQKIESDIHVTKHDERVEWDRNWLFYNPPPTVEFCRIYITATDTEGIADITARLEAGEPFQEIAKSDQNVAPDEGRWTPPIEHTRESPFSPEKFAKTEFSNVEAYNAAVQQLTTGEWVGPIDNERRTRVAWFYLVEITNEPQTFYESQQFVRRVLESRQRGEMHQKRMLKLLQRSSYTDFDEMIVRLLQIAVKRYYPEATDELRRQGG